MIKVSLWLTLILIFASYGCEYILTEPPTVCEPPNRLVKDIYGNDVCVTTDAPLPMPEDEPPVTEEPVPPETEQPAPIVTPPVTPSPPVTPPTGQDMPRKVVTEGELVDFPNLRATDPDGDEVTYIFSAPLSADGTWQTRAGDAGEYTTTITATDGVNEVSQQVLIVVLQANSPPVISGIEDLIVVEEGDIIALNPVVTDADGDDVTVTYSGWMDSPTYTTGYTDAGEYQVIITASDGKSETRFVIDLIVLDVNRPPRLQGLPDLTVEIGDRVEIRPIATDADGDQISFIFSAPLDENGVWVPSIGDEGEYLVTVIATDGKDEDSESFTLTVGTPNLPPVFEEMDDIVVNEGETIDLRPVAYDPEGEDIRFTVSGWMSSFNYRTNYEDSGVYDVTITASDGVNAVSQTIQITVLDVNRPPTWDPGAFN